MNRMVSGLFVFALIVAPLTLVAADPAGEKSKAKGDCPISKAAAALGLAKKGGTCDKADAKLASAKKGTCDKVTAKLASAKVGTCEKATAKLASATKKDACCASKAKLASADKAKGTCATTAKLASAKGKACAASAAGCDSAKGAKLASMLYRVGDLQTSCEKTAKAAAAKEKVALAYLVNGKEYCDRGKAVVALTNHLETEATQMLKVRYLVGKDCVACPNKAASLASSHKKGIKYLVAGRELTCEKSAGALAKRAQKAVAKLAMNYVVGEKKTTCSKTAGTLAKEKGQQVQFVIGKAKTQCSAEAKLLMAQAKVRAIQAAATQDAAGE